MGRGRKARSWVRLDCNGCLHGSINYLLSLAEQAIWFKLIMFSEVCGGPPGFIQDNEGNGVPRSFLANQLTCSVPELEGTIEKMKQDKAINENGSGTLEIVNYETYQFTEYDRQKPYRDKKREEKKAGKISDDPEKYTKGRYSHLVKQ